MRKTVLAGAALALSFGVAGGAWAQSSLEQEIAVCDRKTHAPGAYLASAGGVVPGPGGTALGAANIADCIEDLRAVQYGGTVAPTTAARPAAVTTASSSRCARLLNRSDGEAAARAVGAGLVAGYVGIAVHGAVLNSNYRKCLQAGAATATGQARPTRAASFGCGRNASILVGGTGYCTGN